MASLTEQIPAVVDSVEIFCEKLKEHARKGDIVELDEMVIRLTFDVIMKISLYVFSFPPSQKKAFSHSNPATWTSTTNKPPTSSATPSTKS